MKARYAPGEIPVQGVGKGWKLRQSHVEKLKAENGI